MNKKFSVSLLGSITIHILLGLIIFFCWKSYKMYWSGGLSVPKKGAKEAVWIEASGDQKKNSAVIHESGLKKNTELIKKRSDIAQPMTGQNVDKDGQGTSLTPSGGVGDGLDAESGTQSPSVLQKIRQKIIAAKEYPVAARDQGLEGSVKVVFELSESGTVLQSKVQNSSGQNILDAEALATLKRAEPFPYYSGPISVVLTFALEKNVW